MIQGPDRAHFGKEQPADLYDPVLPDLSELYASVSGELPEAQQPVPNTAVEKESGVKPGRSFVAHTVSVYPDEAPELSVTHFSPVGTGSLRNTKSRF